MALAIAAGGVILLAGIMTPEEYGVYTLALVPASFFNLFIDWGINQALPRFLVLSRTHRDNDQTRQLIWAGLLVKVSAGVMLSIIIYAFADILAIRLLDRPQTADFIRLSALGMMAQPLYETTLAIFTGLEYMSQRSLLAVTQASVKALAALILLTLNLSVAGAILGHVSSYFTAAFVGVVYTVSIQSLTQAHVGLRQIQKNAYAMIHFGFPVFLGFLINTVVIQARLILLPWFVSNEAIGNYQVASNLATLLITIGEAFNIILYPIFSKVKYFTNPALGQRTYHKAIRYSSLITVPLTLLLITVAQPMITTLYGNQYPSAPASFILLSLPSLLVSFGIFSFTPFLNSQNDTRNVFLILVVRAAVALILAPLSLQRGGIPGFIISYLIAHVSSTLLVNIQLRRRYNLVHDYRHATKLYASALVAALTAYLSIYLLGNTLSVVKVMTGTGTFLATFCVLAPLVGTLNATDLDELNEMLGDLKLVKPLIRGVLAFEARLISLLKRCPP
jgi:O-antigen/teichoic acid export membrane protein